MPNTRSCIRHCLKYNLIFAEFKFNWLAGCPVCWPANPVTLVEGDHHQAAGELWDAQPATRRCRVWSRREWQGTGRRKMDRKSTRLNSSHLVISYAVFCLKKKK